MDQSGQRTGSPDRTQRRATSARPVLARWGRTALAGLTPAAWALGAPIDIRAVARRPEPFAPDGEGSAGARGGSEGGSSR